jgi:hypothetical protein
MKTCTKLNVAARVFTICACTAVSLFPGARNAAAQQAAASATGQPGLAGVIRDAANGQPLPQALIIAHRAGMSTNTDLTAVSGADGAFAFAGLDPGGYEISAMKNGFTQASAKVEVAPQGNSRAELALTAAAPLGLAEELAAMKARIEQLEAELSSKNAEGSGEAGQTVLLATAAKEAGQMPQLPTATPKPDERQLLAANLAAAVPAPAAPSPAPAVPQAAAPAPAPAPAEHKLPEPSEAPDPAPAVDKDTPFAYGDQSWFNGSPRNNPVLDTKFFTPEIRFDTHFMTDFNQPIDHTMGGSTESFRSGEVQLEQVSVGGDFHWDNVRGRVLYMNGLFATTTPRNDPSTGVGQWDLRNAYRYFSEAWGGYHWNVKHGLNVDAGIFVSYIGLFSYYNFDNWTYQPSYVSSNTPWFFNGIRIQYFPTQKLKIEPWIINGWQSYARANGHHGFGGQILWIPQDWLRLVFNNYGNGTDTLGNPNRVRLHTDDSIEMRYYNKPMSTGITKMAFTFTGDLGCEYGKGSGVSCTGKGAPKQAFLGWMAYDRIWWGKDKYALTIGGGQMNNPGRYLTLLPPINGADAISGSPYFTGNPGDKAHMWDTTVTLHWMPKQYITWWMEGGYRHSDIPYFSGRGGITPPGGNTGLPSQYVCSGGGSAGTNDLATAYANCGGKNSVWFPDLRKDQATISAGVMVKF